jgi:hypothetical protein
MRLQLFRSTIRSLMVAVIAVGLTFAFVREWRDLLPFAIMVVVPLCGLAVGRAQIQCPPPFWRFEIPACVAGWLVLAIGWLWSHCLILHFQRQEGARLIGQSARANYYEFWALTIPAIVTAVSLVVHATILTAACASRRRRPLLPIVLGQALMLAFAYIWCFADLSYEMFD